MEKTTLYLPADLQRELRESARKSGTSQAELVRAALRAYLDDAARPEPRSLGLGEDEGLSGAETAAWLAREWAQR